MDNIDKQNQQIARAALASKPMKKSGSCLSDLEIAQLVDGKVKDNRKEQFFDHLYNCPECYNLWLATAASVEEAQDKGRIIVGPWSLSQIKYRKLLQTGGAITALAASVVFIVWLSFGPSALEKRITNSYQHFSAAVEQEEVIPLPWQEDKARYGFTIDKPQTPASKAFAMGLWQGRQKLIKGQGKTNPPSLLAPSGDQSWLESEYAGYYWLGEWCSLLWSSCANTNQTAEFYWQEQLEVAQELTSALQKRSQQDLEAPNGLFLVKFNPFYMNCKTRLPARELVINCIGLCIS